MVEDLRKSASQITCEICAVLLQSTKAPATLQQFQKLLFFFESFLEIDSSLFSCLLLDECILFSIMSILPSLNTKKTKKLMCTFLKNYGLLMQEKNVDVTILEKIDRQWAFYILIVFKHCVHSSKPSLIPLFFQLVDFLVDLVKRLPTSKFLIQLNIFQTSNLNSA